MIFNFSQQHQFTTRVNIDNEQIEVLDKTKLLGTIITNDLKWKDNTDFLVRKANMRMQLLHKIASFNPPIEDLKQIYTIFIRSILEQSCVVWHSSLTQEESDSLERVQKSAVKTILNNHKIDYEKALSRLNLDTLSVRRNDLCEKFATKCLGNDKTKSWFQKKNSTASNETKNKTKI